MSEAAKPPWLDETPLMRGFLKKLLKALDADKPQPQRIRLTPGRCPMFYEQLGEGSDWLWELFEDIEARGLWHIVPLKKRRNLDTPVYQDRSLLVPYQSKVVFCDWLAIDNPDQQSQDWRTAISRAGLPDELADKPLHFKGRSHYELAQQCQRLMHSTEQLTLYQFSARYFWGDSKWLSDNPRAVASLLNKEQIKPRQTLLHFYLPEAVEQLLLVENQDTYLELVSSGYARQHKMAIGFMAGYKGAEQHIRIAGHHCVHWHPDCANADGLKQALLQQWSQGFAMPLYYWGDADSEGLHIFSALKKQLTELQPWQPGYQALLVELNAGCAHRKDKQRPLPDTTGSTWLDKHVLPVLKESGLAVDQEAATL